VADRTKRFESVIPLISLGVNSLVILQSFS